MLTEDKDGWKLERSASGDCPGLPAAREDSSPVFTSFFHPSEYDLCKAAVSSKGSADLEENSVMLFSRL